MLREKPQLRPNIYEVVRELCLMQGVDIPIRDVSFSSNFQSNANFLDLRWTNTIRNSPESTSTKVRSTHTFAPNNWRTLCSYDRKEAGHSGSCSNAAWQASS